MVTRCIGKPGVLLLSTALLIATAAPLFAQAPSLGEIARKEQERRKGTKTPTKVLTNDDLKSPPPAPPSAADSSRPASEGVKPAAPAAQAESKKSGKDADDPAPKGEQEWRARITSARDELHRNEVFVEALQSRINALTTDFAARDNPIERAQIADDRQKALAELERVKADIEKSKKQIADIEEEARKAGVPPGWLR